MSAADRKPVLGKSKQGRTLFLVIVGIVVLMFAAFLFMRPRGSESGPPQNTTSQH
jgi:hypothetical protein